MTDFMTVQQLLQMLQYPVQWGRGLTVGRARRANRLRASRGLVLVAYLVMNLGLPTGLGPKVAVAAASDKSCHCSAESRAAGRCCCSVKAGQKPRGCCVNSAASKEQSSGRARLLPSRESQSTHIDSAAQQELRPPTEQKPTAVTKSCCAKKAASKPAETTVAPAEKSSEATLAWTGGCPCSPGDELSMLLCAHPRILVNEGPMEFCFEGRDTVLLLLSQSPCGDRARPCVPPPEASLV